MIVLLPSAGKVLSSRLFVYAVLLYAVLVVCVHFPFCVLVHGPDNILLPVTGTKSNNTF